MSDVYKAVVAKISVQTDPSVQAGFRQVSDNANKAAADMEAVGVRGSRGLKELGGQLRQTDRGFKQLQGGVYGLLGSLSLMDSRLSQPLAIFATLHSGTQAVRGLAGAMPAVSTALGALTSPLGLTAVGFGTAAAGALYFAHALAKAGKETEEMKASVTRLQMQGLQIRAEKMLPGSNGLTIGRYDRVEREHGVAAPFLAESRRVQDELAQLEYRRQAMERHPLNPFPEEPLRRMRESSSYLQGLFGGPQARFGAGEQSRAIQEEQDRLRRMVESPLSRQPLAERQLDIAKRAFDASHRQSTDLKYEQFELQSKLRAKQELDTSTRALQLPMEIQAVRDQIDAKRRNFGPAVGRDPEFYEKQMRLNAGATGFFEDRGAKEAVALMDRRDKLLAEQKQLGAGGAARAKQAQRMMDEAGIGANFDNAGAAKRLLEIEKELQEVAERKKQSANALVDAQENLNRLSLEELRSRKAITEEGVKSARDALHQKLNQIATKQGDLGLMEPGQLESMKSAATMLNQAVKTGNKLSPEIARFIGGDSILAGSEAWEQYRRQRFEASPDAKDVAGMVGLNKQAGVVGENLRLFEGMDKKLADAIGDKVKADETLLANSLANVLAPAFRNMFDDIQKRFVNALIKMARDEAKKAFDDAMQKRDAMDGAQQRAGAQ